MLDLLLTLISTILLAHFVLKHARRNLREYAEHKAKKAARQRATVESPNADSAQT